MLDRFRQAQEPEVARLKARLRDGTLPKPFSGRRPPFAARLRAAGPGAVIAEYKRASPSRGAINLEAEPEAVAVAYRKAGAAALSVLTERAHFSGDTAYLSRMAGAGLPLLRKDFLIDPVQVAETAATPASALLLIARLLDRATFALMLAEACAAGLEAVLEVFDEADLEKTREVLGRIPVSGPIIQVNNRNLETLGVDEGPSRRLIRHKRPGEVWISASGVERGEQILERASLGFDAVLVGSALMQSGEPGGALAGLLQRTES